MSVGIRDGGRRPNAPKSGDIALFNLHTNPMPKTNRKGATR